MNVPPTLKLTLLALALSGLLAANAAEPPDYLPLPFGCEVRYRFRERIAESQGTAKKFSAVDHLTEALPGPRWRTRGATAIRYVEGTLRKVPLHVRVTIACRSVADRGSLRAEVTDTSTGKALRGFPKVLGNARFKLDERLGFELPLNAGHRARLARHLPPHTELVSVTLVCGFDIEPDFGQ